MKINSEAAARLIGMNPQEQASATLDDATIKQMTWKQRVCAIVTRRILEEALRTDVAEGIRGHVWPDQIDFSDLKPEDKNVIGMTFRNLRKQGLLKETGKNRRSEADGANGRRIFGYCIGNIAAAKTLVERTGGITFDEQQQLPL